MLPEPAGQSSCLDAEGNLVASVWFDGEHEELGVRATSRVRTLRENSFDYLLEPSTGLPIDYPRSLELSLAAARRRIEPASGDDPVGAFAREIAGQSRHRLVPFVGTLNEALHERLEIVRRDEGDPWSPSETWRRQQGACRDLAVLFIDACRVLGLAARFVSGYQEGDPDQESRDLHAWAEVYLPGAGWRGYDPTLGLVVADRHVALAAAPSPEDAAPVSGSLRGTGASSTMEATIEIDVALR